MTPSWRQARHARLKAALPMFVSAVLATMAVTAARASSRADLFEDVTALDVDRHLLVTPLPCAIEGPLTPVDHTAPPVGFAAPCASPGVDSTPSRRAFTVGHTLAYRNLLTKNGTAPTLGHDDLISITTLRARRDRLDLRGTVEHADQGRSYAGEPAGFALDASQSLWSLHASLAIDMGSWLSPTLTLRGGSDNERAASLALRGTLAELRGAAAPLLSGFAWSLSAGQRTAEPPFTLDLPEYRPLALTYHLRQNHQSAALGWHGGPVEVAWMTRARQNRLPSFDSSSSLEGYTLSAHGTVRSHHLGGAWSTQPGPVRYRAAVAGELLEGRNTFQGVNARDVARLFSYEETRHAARGLRADLHVQTSRWEGGLFAGGARITGHALRPDQPLDRSFWDRSGAVENYEGSILSVFDQETWLFDGTARFTQQSFGGWGAATFGGWRCRLGVAHQVLDFTARGHLTKYRTVFLVGSSQTHHYPDFAGVNARLLTPELGVSRRLGAITLEASGSQAVPLEMTLRNREGTSAPHSPAAGSSWSGGSRAALKIGWAPF